jgi:hypothetical protein
MDGSDAWMKVTLVRVPIYAGHGEGMVTGKEVNERLWFWILTVTSSCWLKVSVRDPSNCQELPKLYIKRICRIELG